jgi:hypothetical protein
MLLPDYVQDSLSSHRQLYDSPPTAEAPQPASPSSSLPMPASLPPMLTMLPQPDQHFYTVEHDYSSISSLPPPSIAGSIGSDQSSQMAFVGNALNHLIQEQQNMAELIRRQIRTEDNIKISQAQFEQDYPVAKDLLYRTTLLTSYYVYRDVSHRWLPLTQFEGPDAESLVRLSTKAMSRILHAHAESSQDPDDGKLYFVCE